MTSFFEDRDADEPLPRWALRTPTRSVEWWRSPALLAAVAALFAAGPLLMHFRVFPLIACLIIAAGFLAATIVLALAGRHAFVEQAIETSWRLHQTRVIVTAGLLLLVGILGVVSGTSEVLTVGVVAFGVTTAFRGRSALRFERVVTLVTTVSLGIVAAASVAAGFLIPQLDSDVAASWIGGGAVLLVVIAIVLVLQIRALRVARQDRSDDGTPCPPA